MQHIRASHSPKGSSYRIVVSMIILCFRVIYIIINPIVQQEWLWSNSSQAENSTIMPIVDNIVVQTGAESKISNYQQKEQEIITKFWSWWQYSGIIGSIDSGVNISIKSAVWWLSWVRYTPVIRPTIWSSQQLDIARLQYIYTQTRDPKVAWLLVSKYILDYRYNEAYALLSPLNVQQQVDLIWAEKLLFIAANWSLLDTNNPWWLSRFTWLLMTLHSRWLVQNDTLYWYEWLLRLVNWDVWGYSNALKKITSPVYMPQITKTLQRISWFSQQKDLPEYYLSALIALDLMHDWYIKIAQQISARILLIKDSYILPHQILAYSHFVLNNWTVATQYALWLLDLDSVNRQRYLFMLGVSAYRQAKYKDAVMYLNQVRDSELMSDARRYMLLSYQSLWDTKMIASTIQILLGQSYIEPSDFGTMFDILFYQPYAQRSWFSLYNQNKQLSIIILEQCYNKLSESDQTVCTYGKAWILIAQWYIEKAVKYLYFLAQEVPTSAIYDALGQYYSSQNNTEKARNFMIQAALLSTDPVIKQRIKETLMKK